MNLYCLYIYTKFCFKFGVKSCSWVGDLNGLHTYTGECGLCLFLKHLEWHALVLAKCSKLVYRAGLYAPGRVMMAQGPLCGGARRSHGISVEGEMVTKKIDAWASAPISCPQCYELAISRMKRSGVEFIVASHILQASPVWSVPPPQEC